jgi:hypothetical protein
MSLKKRVKNPVMDTTTPLLPAMEYAPSWPTPEAQPTPKKDGLVWILGDIGEASEFHG